MVTIGPRAAPWLLVALLISLAINLFVGGLAAGRHFAGSPAPTQPAIAPPQPGERVPVPAVRRFIAALPEEHRPIVEASLAERRPQIAAATRELRAARERVRDVLVAERFDRAALDAALEGVRDRNADVQRVLHQALVQAADRLPQEARRAIAEAGRRSIAP